MQVKDKDAEIAESRATIDELRALLESETLCKVDYQNNLQSLNEELAFRKKVYEEVGLFLGCSSNLSWHLSTFSRRSRGCA